MAEYNITMRQKNSQGEYDTLYPATTGKQVSGIYTAEETLTDITAALYNLDENAVPNDVFIQLAVGVGQYGYAITVTLTDGSPVPGATITGIDGIDERPIITNNQGIGIGTSSSQNVSINITSPYLDFQNVSSYQINSTGTLTNQTIQLQPVESDSGQFYIQTSNQYTLSPIVKTYDMTAVGGGGGGGCDSSNDSGGGGGGYVTTVLNISAALYREINVNIGAGGTVSSSVTTSPSGGSTNVYSNNKKLIEATGGASPIYSQYWLGGIGNGNGGAAEENGLPGSGYIFNDSSLGIAGGGGGGGGGYHSFSSGQGYGGTPFGGRGGSPSASPTVPSQAPTGPGGGGPGGVIWGSDGLYRAKPGAAGAVYFRFHY